MSTEIYYFSGTGNSLYVAKELQNRIPDSSLIPIVSLLHKDAIQTNAKSVGIVFPVHALTIPIAVKRFLKKLDMKSAEKKIWNTLSVSLIIVLSIIYWRI